MSDLTKLADRCEKANGPERELDCLIFEAQHLLLLPIHRGTIDGKPTGQYFDQDGNQLPERAPFYTTSIDAAVTLIPDGFCLASLGFCEDYEYPAGWHCELVAQPEHYVFVGLDDPMNFHREDPRRIRTPALALCAAALRARATTNSSGDRKSQ